MELISTFVSNIIFNYSKTFKAKHDQEGITFLIMKNNIYISPQILKQFLSSGNDENKASCASGDWTEDPSSGFNRDIRMGHWI